jgi:tRNA pseudouridine38-40 synthase
MQRLLLTLRYDGTRYHGWQVQNNAVTVQQTLQDAVERVTGKRSDITGCSRTDAGVHADMFCCTTETESSLRGDAMTAALNAHLPRDIAVYDCREVSKEFHPRYSAVGKRYLYRIWNANARNPFWENRALHLRQTLDTGRLNAAASGYMGTHDFASFCAAGSSVKDTVRTVSRCGVARDGELVTFSVEADGFLYNMVRIMVGTLLEIAAGKRTDDCIPAVIEARSRNAAGATAPACGLILSKVFYNDLTID